MEGGGGLGGIISLVVKGFNSFTTGSLHDLNFNSWAISDSFIDCANKQDTFLRRSSILKLYWPIRPRLHPSHLEANIILR